MRVTMPTFMSLPLYKVTLAGRSFSQLHTSGGKGSVHMQVIDLSREQERSKQAEAKKAEAEAQQAAQSYAIVRPLLCLHSLISSACSAALASLSLPA